MNYEDPERDARIHEEYTVDAYDDSEILMGWYYSMQDIMTFPFKAKVEFRKKGGKKVLEKVKIVELSSEDKLGNAITVGVEYQDLIIDIPVYNLQQIKADEKTIQIIEDWKYWNNRL